MDPLLNDALKRGNPVVFLDVSIGGAPAGRLKLELFKKDCPKTVENFRKSDLPVGYKACTFHRVIKDFMVQGGDFLKGDGTGRMSIYGDKFPDENFLHKHTEAGLLSMANSGPNSNGCQFFITCAPCDWLDGKHVVFGKLLDPASLLLLRKMESVPVGPNSKPKLSITITDMSKRAYNLQKGRQLQALHESVEASGNSNSSSGKGRVARDVAKIRDLCPPGTDDDRLVELVEKARGDSGLMESAISELWEDYRGGAQDEWATVEKKGKKKNDTWSTPARRDGPKRQPQPQKQQQQQQQQQQQTPGDDEVPGDDRSAATRGRGSGVRGRGAPAARGGRGGGRGRGRGSAPRSGGARATQNDESGEDDAEAAGESSQDEPQKTQKTEQAAPVAPTPVIPHLTGAWTKKPSFVVAAKPKPVAAPAPKPAEKPKEAPAPAAAPAPVASPKKTPQKPSSPPPAAVEPTEPVASPKKKAPSPKKVQSPVAKTPEVKPTPAEKVASPKAEKAVEAASISTWGSLDVSTSAIGDWSASSATTEKKGASTPNAWARGSPIVTAENTQASIPTVSPGSPKDLVAPAESRSAGSAASPKYLKLGRWDTGVATNLSLQFGSFSLNGVEHVESSSPAGWASTTTATSTSKTAVKAAETQNVWGTQSSSPKKKAPLSPARQAEENVHERKSAVTTSAPPGLSVESGRATPKGSQSPRTFAAPSAPSPASLPKPDEVKRNTPNRNQSSFQATAQTQQSKIGAGSTYAADFGSKSSTLYQSSYGQYSMGIGAAGNQNQIPSASGTPKSGPSRAAASAPASAQSPSHGAQQQSAQQFQQQQAQAQPQQQKPAAQQGGQAQTPSQQQPQQQQGQGHHQGHPHHHQAGPPGYHPHYAPPPPPGMAMAYNPYNYASYYQGYGYYQNPQYAQYSPRTQYPPRGSMPYGVEGPMPGFSNPPNVPVGYQDQHLLAHQHDYPGAVPQGFGEVSGAYLQQGGHHHHLHQQNGPQSHGKGSSQISSSAQQPRSGSGMQGYQASSGAGAREHTTSTPPVPNPGAAGASGAAYGQHYGWASYGNQPMGGWGHMMHQGYQNPTQHQHSGSHQQSYRQYSGNNAQAAASANDSNSGNAGHGHAWSS
ncbi:hypothetical protein ATCC90586_009910 [Pythium insidiosum]|nr:hypothetical protein ATCC90586_009910 [Pythium insidiosum]